MKLVFTSGVFDNLHSGHRTHLEHCKGLFPNSVLVVAVCSDIKAREIKGPNRPRFPQNARMSLVAALDCVDYVVIGDGTTYESTLRSLRPDCWITPAESPFAERRQAICRRLGITYIECERKPPEGESISTTKLLAMDDAA